MASLFLSYSRDDALRVGQLATALEDAGHQVWWDRHISGGQQFADVIETALESADVVVVCWSSRSVRSSWVRDEAASGRDRGRLVPVTIDKCSPPLGFRQYHTIDLTKWDGRPQAEAIERLKTAIAEMSGAATEGKSVTKHHAPPSPGISKRRWVAALAGIAALAACAAYLYPALIGRSASVDPTVAVGNFGQVSSSSTLPDMVGQEIVAAFGAENAVTVISPGDRNGSRAPYVMDGSINRVGDAARFTINLKNQRTGIVLWSGTYEQEGADAVAARQAAVGASQVVRCGLWGASSYQKRMSDQALSLYLKWCNELWSGSTSETAELDAARRVTVAMPDFSFGWSALALATVPLAATRSEEAGQLREEGRSAARKSMQLDSQNPEGYMALAGLLPMTRYADRETLLKKALTVRPTECGCERQAYGDFLASVGRMNEAVEQYERARDMRPLAPFSNVRLAQALYVVGRKEEGDRILNSTLQLWPEATSVRLLKIKSALWTRRYDDAIAELRSPDLPLTSTKRAAFAAAFRAMKSGDGTSRSKSVAEIQGFAADPRYNDKIVVGLLAALGAKAMAVQAAENLIRARGLYDAEVLFEPNLAASASEPTYAALVGKLGLIDYWRSASTPPDVCRDAVKPRFCGRT